MLILAVLHLYPQIGQKLLHHGGEDGPRHRVAAGEAPVLIPVRLVEEHQQGVFRVLCRGEAAVRGNIGHLGIGVFPQILVVLCHFFRGARLPADAVSGHIPAPGCARGRVLLHNVRDGG